MRKVEVFGRELELTGGPLALYYYKEEFGGNLPRKILELSKSDEIDIDEYLRIAYAMNATALHGVVYGYERWLEDFDETLFDLGATGQALVMIQTAIKAEMFCSKQTLRERIIRRVAGWLLARLGRS